MNTLLFIILALAAIAAVCYILTPARLTAFNAVSSGTTEGARTFTADAAITSAHLLVTHGSAAGYVALCGANGLPWGPVQDEAAAAGDGVPVELLGSARRTLLGISAGAIAAGDRLVPAANGQIRSLTGAAAGTHYICGRALEATSGAGEKFEFVPSFPQAVTVS